jgi:hypothetical protein
MFKDVKSLKYSLSHYHAVDYGDHGKRNEKSFSILMDILMGHNTSEELKYIYSRKMTLEEAKAHTEELKQRADDFQRIIGIGPSNGDEPSSIDPNLTENDLLHYMAIEFQKLHNKEKRISKKAVDYHIRRLTNKGLIVKRKGRYYLNFRSAKAVRTILELMQSARQDLLGGFHRLMEIWVSIARVEIKDVIADPEGMKDRFTEYTIEFMSYPKNLKDFYLAWTVPIVYGVGVKEREEVEVRFRDYFNILKHYFNMENFTSAIIENEVKTINPS